MARCSKGEGTILERDDGRWEGRLLTIAELLVGKGIAYPRHAANVTHRRAHRAKDQAAMTTLPLEGD